MSELDSIKKSILISSVIGRDVALTQNGVEFDGLCPFHADNKIGNFKVNDYKGIYNCFSCKAHGDMFDYLKNSRGMDLRKAKEYLGMADILRSAEPRKQIGEWIPIHPVPADAPKNPNFKHYKHGDPKFIYPYLNAERELMGYTCRLEYDGKKEVLPFTFCEHSDTKKRQWVYKGFAKPRPVYGLENIASGLPVLIVEGEKCKDAAQAALPEYTVISWIGGVAGVKHTDWTPLAGCDVVIWPDDDKQKYDNGEIKPRNEQPGYVAAYDILKQLPHAKILDLPASNSDGWDVADCIEEGRNPLTFIESTPREASAEISPAPEYDDYDSRDYGNYDEPIPPAEPVVKSKPTDNVRPMSPSDYGNDEPFRHLGYDAGHYYFFSNTRLQVIVRSAAGLSMTSNLAELASVEYWEDQTGGDFKGIAITMLVHKLISISGMHGIFNPDMIRGRGAWTDGENTIIHAGMNLIVNGAPTAISDYRSKFIYPAAQKIRFSMDTVLSNAEANKFKEICESFLWEKPIYATFLAGWAVVAPVCGALNWRPHVWITSKAGGGKSWIQENILRPMMGDMGVIVQGRTSEAGIRQTLGNDALPVLFDEAESENEKAGSVIESILALMRQASSDSNGKIIKGTPGGKSMSFSVRSSFALSSISVPLVHLSDISRITVLSLIQDGSKEAQENFAELQQRVFELITPEYSRAMQARTVQHIHTLKKNALVFGAAAAKFLGNKRLGDQMGILIAGAYLLCSTGEVTESAAYEWISKRDWSEQQIIKEESDEQKLLFQILNSVVRISIPKGTPVSRNVAELIQIVRDNIEVNFITPDNAHDELLRMGLKVEPFHVIISNNHVGIKNLLRNTSWSINHARTLERIDGANQTKAMRFKGTITRAVSVPYGG